MLLSLYLYEQEKDNNFVSPTDCPKFINASIQVHVQSDPAGRLVISGEPEQPDNPWGVTPFKKVDG